MTLKTSMALGVAASVLAVPLFAQQSTTENLDVIPLTEWRYDDLYSNGVSASSVLDREVYGSTGEEIGDVEDILIGPDQRVMAIIAQVGGFWDIGDTHVSIPVDMVEMTGDVITVPITEDTVGDYGFWNEAPAPAGSVETEIVEGVDDQPIPRAWRVTELIGDYARVREGNVYGEYGYVNDLILRDNEVVAAVVQPRQGFGTGYRAYPYYGYGYGWTAGSPYYDMPYTGDEVRATEPLDYNRFGD